MNLKFLKGKEEKEVLIRLYTKDLRGAKNSLKRAGCVEDIKYYKERVNVLTNYLTKLNTK